MAKGIRSKSMRKNRSYLRETVVEPIIQKRQAALNAKLQAAVAAKEPSTLLGLKSLITTTQAEGEKKEGEEQEGEEGNDMEEEEEEVSAPVVAAKKSKKENPFKKAKAVKASKPKHQKEMVWFK